MAVGVAVRPPNHCVPSLDTNWVHLLQIVIAYSFECWSSSGGIGVRAPTMLSKTNSQSSSLRNVGATPRPCGGGLLVELLPGLAGRGIAVCSSFIGHVFSIGGASIP